MQEYITSKIGTKQRTPTTTEYFSTTSYFKNEDQKTEKKYEQQLFATCGNICIIGVNEKSLQINKQ